MTETAWSNVESVDFNNKRIHLHADTILNGFEPIAGYFEIQSLIEANVGNEQNRISPYVGAEGKIKKTDKPTYTPRFALVRTGWRFVPYALTAHTLRILAEIVSKDSITDADVFDLSSVPENINIFSDYDQVEIIEVLVGGDTSDSPTALENAQAVWKWNLPEFPDDTKYPQGRP